MQSEKQFMGAVVELAHLYRWATYHTFNSRRSAAGFPDLVMARAGRLIFAELKAEKGRVSQAQHDWLTVLRCSPGEVYVWRPSDWDDIVLTLR